LFETGIITEITTNYRVDHAGLGFFHAPPLHAIVLSLEQDGQALRFAQFFNFIGEDNYGFLLDMGPGKYPIGDSGKFGDANDPLAGLDSYPAISHNGNKVMGTGGADTDGADGINLIQVLDVWKTGNFGLG
jgi:hypothetical protein